MRSLTLSCLLSVVAFAQPFEAASLKSYQGPEGQRVEVLLLKPLKDQRAFVRVTGANSPVDGLVLPAKSTDAGPQRTRAFTTRLRGADWEVLRLDEGRGEVFAPEVKSFPVKFVEGKADAAELITTHQAQWKSGELAMAAKKEFPFLVTKYEAKATAATLALGKSCRARLSFTFAWATFSDADMSDLDAWSLCQPLVNALSKQCSAVQGVTKLVCRRGAELGFERTADTVTFTTTQQGASATAFVTGRLGK